MPHRPAPPAAPSASLALSAWVAALCVGAGLWAGGASGAPAARLAPDAERGAQLYGEACAACHGASGLGDGPLAKATATPAPALAGQVRPDPEAVARLAAGRGDMPGFGQRFGESDLRRILTFLGGLDPLTGEGPGKPKPKPADKATPKPPAGGADGAEDEAEGGG